MISAAHILFVVAGAFSWGGPIRRRELALGLSRLKPWKGDPLTFLLVITVTLVTGSLAAMAAAGNSPTATDIIFSGMAFHSALAACSLIALRLFDRSTEDLFSKPIPGAKSGLLAVLRTAPLIAGAAFLSTCLLGPINSEALNQLAVVKGIPLMLAVTTATIIGPISEELFCRGVIQRWIAARATTTTAAWISCVIFAVMHFDASSVLPLMVVGFSASVLAIKTGGLVAPIVFHMFFNATQLLFTFVA